MFSILYTIIGHTICNIKYIIRIGCREQHSLEVRSVDTVVVGRRLSYHKTDICISSIYLLKKYNGRMRFFNKINKPPVEIKKIIKRSPPTYSFITLQVCISLLRFAKLNVVNIFINKIFFRFFVTLAFTYGCYSEYDEAFSLT